MAHKDDPTPKAHTDDPKAHSSSAFGHIGLVPFGFLSEESMEDKLQRLGKYVKLDMSRQKYIIKNHTELMRLDPKILVPRLYEYLSIVIMKDDFLVKDFLNEISKELSPEMSNNKMIERIARFSDENYLIFLVVLANGNPGLVNDLTDGEFFITRQTEELISEDGGSITLDNFDLQIPKNSVEKPVTVSVSMIDFYPIRLKVHYAGLQGIVRPIVHFGLEPHGQKFLHSVSLALNLNLPEDKHFLIFHKDINHEKETEWTDITDESIYKYTEGKLSFQTDSFSQFWIFIALPVVSVICSKLLNCQQEVCSFFAYYKKGEEFKVFVEKKKGKPDHTPPTGYKLYDEDSSWCELFATDDLAFYNKYHDEPVERSINMIGFRKRWEEIDLPKNFTPHLPPFITVTRRGLNQPICKLEQKSEDPSTLPFEEKMNLYSGPPESREDKKKRLERYMQPYETRGTYITKTYETLLLYMDTKKLLPRLVSSGVIDHDDEEGILGCRTIHDQNQEMVGILRMLDKDKYFVFLEVLADNQKDLVQVLTDWNW